MDAFKVWVALQRYGARGLGALYDRLCAAAATLYDLLRERSDFQVLHEPEGNILCFRYWVTAASMTIIATLSTRACAMHGTAQGRAGSRPAVLGGRRVLRVTLMNPRTQPVHLRQLVEALGRLGQSLATPSRT